MVSPQATEPRHLDVPGRRLHPLKGDLAGYWSITVSARPGLSVRYDCIEPLGLTITEAADVLDVTRQTLNNLVNGKSGIWADIAIRLDKAFGGAAETWLPLATGLRPRAGPAARRRSQGQAGAPSLDERTAPLRDVINQDLCILPRVRSMRLAHFGQPDQRSRSTTNSRRVNVTIFEISATTCLCSGSWAKLSCA
jgi:addiction module HigA family antidote